MSNKHLICLLAFILATNICPAQTLQPGSNEQRQNKVAAQQRLTGKITGIDGEAVRATIRSIRNGMSLSQPDGQYSLDLKALPDTLTFSAVGYITLKKIVTKMGNLDLKMTPNVQALNEVVVQTGYQTLKPNEINGTVSVISEQALQSTTGTNILDRILNQSSGLLLNTGKTPGNPQNRTNISIRGLGTIDGPLDPLIVLDGFIYEGDINNINPNDIENVSILKDASASSIWGARAGNGVIVITSKKGRLNQPPQIGFNANALVETLPDLFAVSQMDTRDYIGIERMLFDQGYFSDQASRFPFRALPPAVELMLQNRLGNITNEQLTAKLDYLFTQDSRQNYLDAFYTHAITEQYGLNLKGGGGNNSYYISAGYDRSLSETFAKNNRLNLKLANDFRFGNKLVLSTLASYTANNSRSGRPAYNSITTASRNPIYLSFRDENGNAIPLDRFYRGAYTDTAARGKLLDWKYYPLENHNYEYQTTNRQEFFASGTLKYKLTNFLQLDLGFQHQQQRLENLAHAEPESYAARNLTNTYSQFNYTTQIVRYIVPVGGTLSTRFSDVASSTARTQLNLDKKLGVHAINAILGAEGRNVNNSGDGNNRFGYYEDPLSFTDVDIVTRYPEFLTKSTSAIGGSASMSSTRQRFLSFYGNLSYSYMGRYHLSASARKDGSNIFGANTNDRWKPLWSAGLGWSVSNESFYNLGFLPTLNLKATYGYSGNVDLSRTALPIAAYGSNATSGLRYTRIVTINNPELKWEQLSQLDLKLDFATKKNRISGTLSYYIKKGTDLYGTAPYDYTTWGRSAVLTRNVAAMKGSGVDIDLRGKILEGKLQWNAELFVSRNESKTTDYYRSSGADLHGLLNGGNRISPIIGMPLYGIAAYRWAGLDPGGNPQGYVNGQPSINYTAITAEASATGNNLVFIGRSTPLYFGALINTFSYKQVSLSVNINFKLAYYFMKNSINYNNMISSGTTHADFAKRWQQPGDETRTHVPSFLYPANAVRDGIYNASEIHAARADHARLSYIRLAYTPNIAPWGIGLRRLEIFSGLQEGGILWRKNRDNLDPDYNNQIPPAKQFTFGLRGSF
ncbi:SusC/RagA family TonB-linked outer membrane protein [Pedobacter sp.]